MGGDTGCGVVEVGLLEGVGEVEGRLRSGKDYIPINERRLGGPPR